MRRDPQRARRYFELSAQAGYPEGQYNLAVILIADGSGAAREQARSLLASAALRDYPNARGRLASLGGPPLPASAARVPSPPAAQAQVNPQAPPQAPVEPARPQSVDVFSFDLSGVRLHMGAEELERAVLNRFPSSIRETSRCTHNVLSPQQQYICQIQINAAPFRFIARFAPRVSLPGLRPSQGQEVAIYLELSYTSMVPADVDQEFRSLARQKYGLPTRNEFPRSASGEWTWTYCGSCSNDAAMSTSARGHPNLRVMPQITILGGQPPGIVLEDPSYERLATTFLQRQRDEQQQEQQRRARPPL